MAIQEGDSIAAGDWLKAAHVKVVHGKDRTTNLDELTTAWEHISVAVSFS